MTDLEQLLVEHQAALTDFVAKRAWRSLAHLESIEDLVQGVTTRALDRREQFEFRGEAAFRAWLFEVAERHLVDRRRHWLALRRAGSDVLRLTFGDSTDAGIAAVRDLAASVTGPSTFASRREQVTLAARALALLLPRDRELVEGLSRGRTLEEEAARLGLTYGATQRARHRALERLRRTFELVLGSSG